MFQHFEVRKIHSEGAERISRGMTIPHKFLKELGLEQGNYIKIYIDEKEGNRKLWIEKLEE